jgi:hypothetical protein
MDFKPLQEKQFQPSIYYQNLLPALEMRRVMARQSLRLLLELERELHQVLIYSVFEF